MVDPPHTHTETFTHQVLDPGAVAGRRHGQLDDAAAQEAQQQDGRDVLPHVVVEAVRRKAQHVLQVFKESAIISQNVRDAVRQRRNFVTVDVLTAFGDKEAIKKGSALKLLNKMLQI